MSALARPTFAAQKACPLYPRKRTCAVQLAMSAKCQKRTYRAREHFSDEYSSARQDNPDLGELTRLRIDFD